MHDLPTLKPYVYILSSSQNTATYFINLASIIKIPPAKPADQPYEDLVCTEQDKLTITEIITAIGENGKLGLLFMQGYLRTLGVQVDHVHPLKFLAIVFSNMQLKIYMNDLFKDYFKRNGFMEGLAPNMTREQEKGKLQQYIPHFAKELNLPSEMLRPYFQSSDWEGLVQYLIDAGMN